MNRFHRQDGATAVVVSLSLLVLMAIGALAVDAGSLWSTKRDFHAGTDAAALAAGRHLYPDRCAEVVEATELARNVFAANVADADPSAVTVTPEGPCGKVTVSYTGPARMTFAGVLGFDSLSVYADTTVSPGDFVGGGLRPFSVCYTDPEIAAWLDLGAGARFRLDPAKTWKNNQTGATCNGAAGNWGFVCYDKDVSSCGTQGLRNLIRNGYDGEVDLGTDAPGDSDCQEDAAVGCDAKTGSEGNALDGGPNPGPLSAIVCRDPVLAIDCAHQFPILGVSGYTSSTGSADLVAEIFIGVVLRDFGFSGNTGAWFEFELVNLFDQGTSTTATGGFLERTSPVICGVDHQPGSVDYCEQ